MCALVSWAANTAAWTLDSLARTTVGPHVNILVVNHGTYIIRYSTNNFICFNTYTSFID